MSFNVINNELHKSIKILDDLYKDYNILDNTVYSKKVEVINIKLNELYYILYNKLNISYHQIVIIDKIRDEDRMNFINCKTKFIKELHIIKKDIMFIKEKLYPWPWDEIELCQEAYIIPRAKKTIEFYEIKDTINLSIKEFHLLTFNKN